MPPTPPRCGPSRPADVVNAEIRALLERTRRQLSNTERAEYDLLVVEWEAAKRGKIVEAA